MKIRDLFEYNEMRLINDFGRKLVARYESEFHKKDSVTDIIKSISKLDPTGNKERTFCGTTERICD